LPEEAAYFIESNDEGDDYGYFGDLYEYLNLAKDHKAKIKYIFEKIFTLLLKAVILI